MNSSLATGREARPVDGAKDEAAPAATGAQADHLRHHRSTLARLLRRLWARLALTLLAPAVGAAWSERRSARLDHLLVDLETLDGGA